MDPVTIITLVTAIVSAVFATTGPILPRLWHGLKRLYGRACQSESASTPKHFRKEFGNSLSFFIAGYLRALGQQRLTNDIRAMMMQNAALRSQANRYYLEGGMRRSSQQATSNVRAGSSGGGRPFIDFSDFSEFSD
jgi:hypothetical protein